MIVLLQGCKVLRRPIEASRTPDGTESATLAAQTKPHLEGRVPGLRVVPALDGAPNGPVLPRADHHLDCGPPQFRRIPPRCHHDSRAPGLGASIRRGAVQGSRADERPAPSRLVSPGAWFAPAHSDPSLTPRPAPTPPGAGANPGPSDPVLPVPWLAAGSLTRFRGHDVPLVPRSWHARMWVTRSMDDRHAEALSPPSSVAVPLT